MTPENDELKNTLTDLLKNESEIRKIISSVLTESISTVIRPIEKKIDELDKKLNQLRASIEGVQFITKEEISTLRADLKNILAKK